MKPAQTPATDRSAAICPVLEVANQTISDARQLDKSMRKLRIAMKQCKDCDKGDGCPALKEFTDRIVVALQEIYELWGLY